MPITIKAIPAFEDNYIWLLLDRENKLAICVDPGESTPVLSYLTEHNYRLIALFLTHHHGDHIGGVADIIQHVGDIKVFGPKDTRINFLTNPIKEGEIIQFNEAFDTFEVIETPGHTLSHICYYSAKYQLLFCGDTLFSVGCGRVFEGSYEQMYQSLLKLKRLPEETKVYCAHEYTHKNLEFALSIEPENKHLIEYKKKMGNQVPTLPSLLKDELKVNPFLRCDQKSIQHNLPYTNMDEQQCFEILRKLKDQF